MLFSNIIVPFCSSNNSAQRFKFLHTFTNTCHCLFLCVCLLFNNDHPTGCEMISQCDFDFHKSYD